MAEWWNALDSSLQIFYLIAFGSTGILCIQLVMNLLGVAGHDVIEGTDAPEMPSETPDLAEHASGLGILSFRTLTAFFVGFGWTGVTMLKAGNSIEVASAVAMVVGFIFLYSVFMVMKAIFGLSESGNVNPANAQGKIATVYTTIPKKGDGSGQIQVIIQSRSREMPAITEEEEPIKPGTPVEVVKVISGNTMVVRRTTG